MANRLGKPLPANIKKLSGAWGTGFVPNGTGGNGTGNPWQVSGYQFGIASSHAEWPRGDDLEKNTSG